MQRTNQPQHIGAAGVIFVAVLTLLFTGCRQGDESVDSDPADATPFELEEGFTQLTLDDFEVFTKPGADGAGTWSQKTDVIQTTGSPRGYLYSKNSHRNFTLRLEYRFANLDGGVVDGADVAKVNTGVLVYITGPHRIWPKCLEVQGKHVEMAHIKSNARDITIEAEDDEAARKSARLPAGQWNRLEIVSKDGALTSTLNGKKICESQPGELVAGPFGLQAEDYPVDFRRLRIRGDVED
jgi:hypothetical protein